MVVKPTVVLLVLLSGCIIYPKQTMTERLLDTSHDAPVAGPVGPLGLRIVLAAPNVEVSATRARSCAETQIQVFEIRKHMETKVEVLDGGNNGDPRGVVVLAALGMVTGVVSGIVSIAILAADWGGSNQREERRAKYVYPCPVIAADVPIDVTFSTGEVAHGTTDASGKFTTPMSAVGPITVRGPGVDVAAHYTEPEVTTESERRMRSERMGFAAVRDALRVCGKLQHVTGVVNAQLAVDRDGHVTADPDRGGDEFGACVRDGLVAIRFPLGHATKLVFPYKL